MKEKLLKWTVAFGKYLSTQKCSWKTCGSMVEKNFLPCKIVIF